MSASMRVFILVAGAISSRALDDPNKTLTHALTPIVRAMAQKYNCSISIALKGAPSRPLSVAIASGVSDRDTGRETLPSDAYVWGSVTKVVTGTGVLRLVDSGKLQLDDPVPPLIDPLLKKMAAKDPDQGFNSLSDLWGIEVSQITVKDLLGMRSGVPDYDTANPGRHPTDTFRAEAYANPNRSYTPAELLTLPWVRTGKLLFTPGTCDRRKYFNCYSSSNYVLLGLLLACQSGANSWEEYAQSAAIATKSDLAQMRFAVSGAPFAWTPVHGYDETHYNHHTRPIDVSKVSGVFGGWTASDLVATAHDAASLAQDVYGPAHALVSEKLQARMYAESSETGYGLATFNLTRLTPNDVAYGHLGATYGYQSVVVYVPSQQLGIAIGTNIETDFQSQPADVFCSIYNTANAILLGKPIPECTYTKGYWHGGCRCK